MEVEDPLVGQTLGGQWRVDARLWTGGMATTYAATHRNGDHVAIKLLSNVFAHDADARAQFLRDGYVANAVGHRGAVRVLDDDATTDSVFLVMELVDGESLEALRMRLGGTVPVDEVMSLAANVLEIVVAAHARGIVHRDLKPENIFVTREGQVKVLDFGIDAPRQGSGGVDGRADLQSLGATFFLLLTGEAPGASSLQSLAPWLPVRIVDVIERALAPRGWADAPTMHAALQVARAAIARDVTVADLAVEDHGNEDRTQLRPPGPWLEPGPEAIPVGPSSDPTLNIPAQPNRVYARGFVPPAAPGLPTSERTIMVAPSTPEDDVDAAEYTRPMVFLPATALMAPLPINLPPAPAPAPYLHAWNAYPPAPEARPIPRAHAHAPAPALQPLPAAPAPAAARRSGGGKWWGLAIVLLAAIALAIAARFAYARMMSG